MAITAANAVYNGTGPTETGQIVSTAGDTGAAARRIYGTGTVTGDAASSVFDVNFIDGTKTLGFTPSLVIAQRSGGAATNTISVLAVEAITNVKFTVRTSANVNAATYIVSFVAMP